MSAVEVVGAGFGRTGTLSLQTALNELGYRTYHMTEALEHKHLGQWAEIAKVKAAGGDVNLDTVLKGYTATCDFPACIYYKELLKRNPNAKVVLTARDPEKWYESAYETILKAGRLLRATWVLQRIPFVRQMGMTMEQTWVVPVFGSELQSRDKQHCIAVYKRHVEEVRRVVPAEQLLVFDVKEGWEPLCKFLGKPVPATPFPNVNDKVEFQRHLAGIRWADRAAVAVLVGIAAAAWAYFVGWR